MPNNYFPTTGISTARAGKQSAPFTDQYTLGVANILPNNQPYYVPGSGQSKTYAPGEIPPAGSPYPGINPNIYKMGQQHLDAWLNAQAPGMSLPNNPPPSGSATPYQTASNQPWNPSSGALGGAMPGPAAAPQMQNQNPNNQGDIPSANQNPASNFDLNAFLASIVPPGQNGNSTVANNLFGVLSGSPSSGTGRYSSATNWMTGPQQQT